MTLPLAAGVTLGGSVSAGGDVVSSPVVPGEEKRQVVEKMVGYVAKNGQAFEDRVRKRCGLLVDSVAGRAALC